MDLAGTLNEHVYCFEEWKSLFWSVMAWRGRGRSGAMMTHNSEAAKEARDQPDPETFPARSALHEIVLPPEATDNELRILENMRRLNTATLSTPYRLKYTVRSNSVDHNIDRYSMRVGAAVVSLSPNYELQTKTFVAIQIEASFADCFSRDF